MATNNPAGMGHKTSRQFRRVAEDIMKYANSVYIYDEFNPVGNKWHDSHGTIRGAGTVKRKPKAHVAPELVGRRDKHKTSR